MKLSVLNTSPLGCHHNCLALSLVLGSSIPREDSLHDVSIFLSFSLEEPSVSEILVLRPIVY